MSNSEGEPNSGPDTGRGSSSVTTPAHNAATFRMVQEWAQIAFDKHYELLERTGGSGDTRGDWNTQLRLMQPVLEERDQLKLAARQAAACIKDVERVIGPEGDLDFLWTEQCSHLETKLCQMEASLDNATTRFALFQDALMAIALEKENLVTDRDHFKAESEKYHRQYIKVQDELERFQIENYNLTSESEQQRQKLIFAYKEKAAIDSLRKENTILTERVHELESDRDRLNEKNRWLSDQVHVNKEHFEMKKKLDESYDRNRSMAHECDTLKAEVAKLQAKNDELCSRSQKEQNSELEKQKEHVVNLERTVDELLDEKKEITAKLRQVEENLSDWQNAYEVLERSAKCADENYHETVKQLQSENATLCEELSKTQSGIETTKLNDISQIGDSKTSLWHLIPDDLKIQIENNTNGSRELHVLIKFLHENAIEGRNILTSAVARTDASTSTQAPQVSIGVSANSAPLCSDQCANATSRLRDLAKSLRQLMNSESGKRRAAVSVLTQMMKGVFEQDGAPDIMPLVTQWLSSTVASDATTSGSSNSNTNASVQHKLNVASQQHLDKIVRERDDLRSKYRDAEKRKTELECAHSSCQMLQINAVKTIEMLREQLQLWLERNAELGAQHEESLAEIREKNDKIASLKEQLNSPVTCQHDERELRHLLRQCHRSVDVLCDD